MIRSEKEKSIGAHDVGKERIKGQPEARHFGVVHRRTWTKKVRGRVEPCPVKIDEGFFLSSGEDMPQLDERFGKCAVCDDFGARGGDRVVGRARVVAMRKLKRTNAVPSEALVHRLSLDHQVPWVVTFGNA